MPDLDGGQVSTARERAIETGALTILHNRFGQHAHDPTEQERVIATAVLDAMLATDPPCIHLADAGDCVYLDAHSPNWLCTEGPLSE